MLPKDIKIVFHDEQPHYSPGSTVKGEVIVTAEHSEPVKSIVVKILGQAHVHWTEESGTGENRRTHHYSNTINYIKEESIVWSKENSPSGELSPGEYSFPFEYKLPEDIPPSFQSYNGKISFEIKVKIAQSGILKGSLKSVSCFTVKVDPSQELLASCMEQKVVDQSEHVNFCCFDFGTIRVTCDLPHTGFSLGDVIPLNLQIENLSTKALRIQASLRQVIIYTSAGGRTLVHQKNFSLLSSPQIQAGVITSFQDDSRLKIPTDAPPTLRNCACIRVEYNLAIRAVAHSLGSSKHMMIPLVFTEEPISIRQ